MIKSTLRNYPYEVIKKHLAEFTAQNAGTRENRDIEYLHRMRVASRRLRTALWAFKKFFPPKESGIWKNSLRGLAQLLGKARDCDIQLAFLNKVIKEGTLAEHKAGLKKLIDTLARKRARLQHEVLRKLNEFETEKITQRITATISRPAKAQGAPRASELYAITKNRVSRRLEDLLSFTKYVSCPEKTKELHRMRIAAKHLRYTLENITPLYGKKINIFIDTAHNIQSLLGRLHDLDVWIAQLTVLSAKEKKDQNHREALARLRLYCIDMRNQVYEEFLHVWNKQTKKHIWPRLAKYIRNASNKLD
ncbi:MAG: CHAD domain-containing protein [Candidatus Omnitrophica bacterium]|nr:CHAD domain-containing protein [Candidatus Omnitrophota bacterium]